MTDSSWDLIVAGTVRRTIERLPAKVAVAVLDFIAGPLLDNPRRVGKELRGDLVGHFSARVGTYRVVFEINETNRAVHVVYIDHRADVYRPR